MLCFFCLSLKCLASGRLDSDYSGICTIAKSNLNPLASGRLDVYDNDNYDMVSDLNPLASGRLDRKIVKKAIADIEI